MLKTTRLAAAATAVSLAFALPAIAQDTAAPETQQPETQQMQEAPTLTVNEEQLDAFVEALRTVDTLEQEYTESLQQAESDEQREAIVAEANTAMAEAIEETPGMTLDEYIAILQQAQTDPELSARIMERFEG
jgi:hypothetical protein